MFHMDVKTGGFLFELFQIEWFNDFSSDLNSDSFEIYTEETDKNWLDVVDMIIVFLFPPGTFIRYAGTWDNLT